MQKDSSLLLSIKMVLRSNISKIGCQYIRIFIIREWLKRGNLKEYYHISEKT